MRVISIVLDAPGDKIAPHLLGFLEIELTSSQEAQQVNIIPPRVLFSSVKTNNHSAKLL